MLSGINHSLKRAVAAVVAVMTLVGGMPIGPVASTIGAAKLTAAAEDTPAIDVGSLQVGGIIAPGTVISGVAGVVFQNGCFTANDGVVLNDIEAYVTDEGGNLTFSEETGAATLDASLDGSSSPESVVFKPYHISDAGTVYWEVRKIENREDEGTFLVLGGHAVTQYFNGILTKNANLGDNEVVVETNGNREAVIASGTTISASDVRKVIIKANVPLDFYDGAGQLSEDENAGAFIQQISGDDEYAYQYEIDGEAGPLDSIDVKKEPELLYDGIVHNQSGVTDIKVNDVNIAINQEADKAEYYDVAAKDKGKNQLIITSTEKLDIYGDTGDGSFNETLKLFDTLGEDPDADKFSVEETQENGQTLYKYTLVKKLGDDVNKSIYVKRAATSPVNGKLVNATGDAVVRYMLNDKLVPVSAQEGKNESDTIVVTYKDKFVIASAWPLKIYDENDKLINDTNGTNYFDAKVYDGNTKNEYGLSSNFPYAYVLTDAAKKTEALEITRLTVVKDTAYVWSRVAKIQNDSATEMDLDGETVYFCYKSDTTLVDLEITTSTIGKPGVAYSAAGTKESLLTEDSPLPYIQSKVQLSLTDETASDDKKDLIKGTTPVFKMEAVNDENGNTTGYKYILIPQRGTNGHIIPYAGTVTVKKAKMNKVFDAPLMQENLADGTQYEITDDDDSTTDPKETLSAVPAEGEAYPDNVVVEVEEDEQLTIKSEKPLYIYEKVDDNYTDISQNADKSKNKFTENNISGGSKTYTTPEELSRGTILHSGDVIVASALGSYTNRYLQYLNADGTQKSNALVNDGDTITLVNDYIISDGGITDNNTFTLYLQQVGNGETPVEYPADKLVSGTILYPGDIIANPSGVDELYVYASGIGVKYSNDDRWTVDGTYVVESASTVESGGFKMTDVGIEAYSSINYEYTLNPTETGDVNCITNPVIAVPEKDEIFEGTICTDAINTPTATLTYQQNGTYGDKTVDINNNSLVTIPYASSTPTSKTNGATKLVITSQTRLDFIKAGNPLTVIEDAFDEAESVKIIKCKKNILGHEKQLTKKIYLLKDRSQHIVEIEEN